MTTTLTFYGHSALRLTKGERSIAVDLGGFSDLAVLDGAHAIVLTHAHPDHMDAAGIAGRASDGLAVYGPEAAMNALRDAGIDDQALHPITPGEHVEIEGFSVATFGGQHAVVHPDIPILDNIAYLFDSSIYLPGDSFTRLPEGTTVDVLALGIVGPWVKAEEAVDFARDIAPATVIPVHDAILNDKGIALYDMVIGGRCQDSGITYRRLAIGESLTIN